MFPNQTEERPVPRQEQPADSEDLLRTVTIAKGAITPIEGLGQSDNPIEVELPEIGTELGRYRLQAVRGMGSASIVYRAQHLALGIPVALKLLNRKQFSDRLTSLEQLRLEANLLARLSHRNIVRLWDFDDDFDRAYLATEYIEGPTLQTAIQDQGRIEPRRAVRIFLQIVDALEGLSHFNVVHRDVKPENLLLSVNGTVKVIDLGLAMILGEESPEIQVNSSRRGWVGTPSYIAPEQARAAQRVDFRADMYSLGVSLFQTLTGQLPFQAKKASQMVIHQIETPPPNPRDLLPEISNPLSELVLRLLAKQPSQRYSTYGELREALQRTLG
jgi:serine/threonine-protein kinase